MGYQGEHNLCELESRFSHSTSVVPTQVYLRLDSRIGSTACIWAGELILEIHHSLID